MSSIAAPSECGCVWGVGHAIRPNSNGVGHDDPRMLSGVGNKQYVTSLYFLPSFFSQGPTASGQIDDDDDGFCFDREHWPHLTLWQDYFSVNNRQLLIDDLSEVAKKLGGIAGKVHALNTGGSFIGVLGAESRSTWSATSSTLGIVTGPSKRPATQSLGGSFIGALAAESSST